MAGYIGTTPVPQATQHRESFTATGGQTSFATAGYTSQFIDVYLNGVKLAPADFTATNGSDVVLASGATASDILEIVAYTPFEVANQTFTGTTTAANLTVTGAFTSQGIDDNANAVAITIDSSENVGIGESSPQTPLHIRSDLNSGYNAALQLDNNSTTVGSEIALLFRSRVGTTNTDFSIAGVANGANDMDLTFLSDGNTERMRIDSSGNVGIGTDAPSSQDTSANNFVIHDTTGNGGLTIVTPTNAIGGIHFSDGTSGADRYRGIISYSHSDNSLRFHTDTARAMTIDSSGNLLVGKTVQSIGTDGVTIVNGQITATSDGADAIRLNRKTSDGSIIDLRKDGTTVGSIGTANTSFGTNPYIAGSGGRGLSFDVDVNRIFPCSSTGARADGSADLGASTARFKDLYLSGGVYLGGTGSANHLDDYEEGTWTPTLNFGGNATGMAFTTQSGSYVKVGQVVTAQFRIELSAKGSSTGNANFGGLPFNATSVGTLYPAFYGLHHDVNSGSGNTTTNVLPIGQIPRNNNTWNYYQADSVTPVTNAYFNNNTVINGTVIFRVN